VLLGIQVFYLPFAANEACHNLKAMIVEVTDDD
jgi:hypothetical protein